MTVQAGAKMAAPDERIPKTMAEALDFDDPYEALLALSRNSEKRAIELSHKLIDEINDNSLSEKSSHGNGCSNDNSRNNSNVLPDLLKRLPNTQDADSHPVATAIACSDSILNSLTKIASGGSQASQEIIHLEQEKRELEQNATDVETALRLRKASDAATQSLSAQRYDQASAAIRDYTQLQNKHRLNKRAKAYAGEYTVTQLESSKKALRATLLQDYQQAVQASDLQSLGKLTPMLQMVECEKEAVSLYLRFLKGILKNDLERAVTNSNGQNNDKNQRQPTAGSPPPYIPMGRIYNTAVTVLRHHLPMVSHCLHRADGDAAVIQLVNVQIEDNVIPLFEQYVSSRQLGRSSRNARRIYNELETRLASEAVEGNRGGNIGGAANGGGGSSQDHIDDAGFSTEIGSPADVDASMEEAVLCLQHGESYTRFIKHTVQEVNKARVLRYRSEQEERRLERERREWTTGMKKPGEEKDDTKDEESEKENFSEEKEYSPLEILPAHTRLQEKLAEVGGFYSTIESTLLLASMQRAFAISPDDPRQYSALGRNSTTVTGNNVSRMNANSDGPLKTSIVESSLYAARRGSQRAFATGHSSTASAVTNYFADCLKNVLAQYLIRRAEDLGVSVLKPGEGLLEGSSGIFGTTTSLGLTSRQAHQSVMGHATSVEEKQRQFQIEEGISRACATMNDLEVAANHTKELQRLLTKNIDQGFPPETPETEQLRVCVLSLGSVAESFTLASDQAVESLLSELKPRIRAIVTDAVGSDQGAHGVGAASGFSSVIGGGGITKASIDRHAVRMNYELDEDTYKMLEVSESYVSRLCTLLDEFLVPLCRYLAPRLADSLVIGVLGTVSKRLEVSLRKVSERSVVNWYPLFDKFCLIKLISPHNSNLFWLIFIAT